MSRNEEMTRQRGPEGRVPAAQLFIRGQREVHGSTWSAGGPRTTGVQDPLLALQCQGTSMPGQWPLRDFMELGPLSSAVPCARLHTRQLLWEWGLTGLSESTELLVSELVTNAVQASRALQSAPPVRLWLLSDHTQVLVVVWDASQRTPARMDVSGDAERGRGLLLVETISHKWGWYLPPETAGGKVVWALCVKRLAGGL